MTIWSIPVQQPTVPPIPTTPLAPASPTSNFELPPEVLEHLMAPADSPHWWAQPIATLCVGLLAIGSAWLAWCSVNKQITANADDLGRQLVAQRTVYDDGIVEERRRLERAERLEVFRDVVNSAVRVTGCIISLHNSRMLWLRGAGGSWKDPGWEAAYHAEQVSTAAAWGMLVVLGLDVEEEGHFRYIEAADAYVKLSEQSEEAEAKAYSAYRSAHSFLLVALETLLKDSPAGKLALKTLLDQQSASAPAEPFNS